MLIKHQAVAQHLQKKTASMYVVIGQDPFLVDEAIQCIKSSIKKNQDCDEKKLSIQSADEWKQVIEEANSYSLFADTVLVTVDYDKKTIDAAGKKILTNYLNATNSRCTLLIRAPNLSAKQIPWLTDHELVLVVVAYSLNQDAMLQWISNQLKTHSFSYDLAIPALIHQYTQGNMLACAQAIEKISLLYDPGSRLTIDQVKEQLTVQCEHSLYELIDACLLGHADKALQILRQAANNKTEAILVLWMLTQEVRILMQLMHHLQNNVPFKTASSQLKIWPQRQGLYQASLKRLNQSVLEQLLRFCQVLDERIKSNMSSQTWNGLESLSVSLALGVRCF